MPRSPALLARRWLTLCACALLLAAPTRAALPQAPLLRIVHFTDSHFPVGKGPDRLLQCFREIAQLTPPPDLIVHTGDVTEFGDEAALDRFVATAAQAPVPWIAVPGNHDVRWSFLSDARLQQALQAYLPADAIRSPVGLGAAFTRNGVRLLLFDSSIPLEQHGAVDPATRAWAKEWLATQPVGPTLAFFHHPPFDPSGVDTPGAFDLLALLNPPQSNAAAPPNAIICGHGHSSRRWVVNGVPIVMTGALYDDAGGYRVFDIFSDRIESRLRRWDGDGTPVVTQVWPPPAALLPLTNTLVIADPPGRVSIWAHPTESIWIGADDTDWIPLPAKSLMLPVDSPLRAVRVRPVTPGLGAPAPDLDWGAVIVERLPGAAVSPRIRHRWALGAGVLGMPASDGRLLFVGDLRGTLHAFDLTTGARAWQADLGERIIGGPAVGGNLVFVGAGESVYALRANDGARLWQRAVPGPVRAPPVFDGDRVYIAAGATLLALRPDNGELRWTLPTGGLIQAGPTRSGDLLYFGAWDNTLRAVHRDTGAVAWTLAGTANHYYSPGAGARPLLDEGMLLVSASPSHGTPGVWALDPATGKVRWTATASAGYCHLAGAGDTVLLASLSGELMALNVADGKTAWRIPLGEPVVGGSVVVAGDTAYTITLRGVVLAFSAADGKPLWRERLGDGYWFSPPLLVDDWLAAASTDGVVCVVTRGATP